MVSPPHFVDGPCVVDHVTFEVPSLPQCSCQDLQTNERNGSEASQTLSRILANAPINCMPHGTPPPPWEMLGFDQGGGQMYPKSPPGDRQNGQTAPSCTRGDHSADWRRSMCPALVTDLVVKFPTPGKAKRSNPPWSPGGGGGVPWGMQLIGA